MIRITQMLLIFGTICLIYITGITSTDEKLFQTSQCIQPIEYNISLEIQNTSLIVNSTVVLNVSCVQHHIRLQIGSYCNLTDTINIEPEDITNIYYFLPVNWTSTRLQSSNQVDNVDIKLVKNEQIRGTVEKPKSIEIGLYMISSIYSCDLEKVAMVFSTYRNQSETKEVLILPRISNEWIFPYWENPATKARFTIQVKHKNNDTVLSNMPVAKTFGTHTLHTVFLTTPPISTHLVAVVVISHTHKTNNETKNNVTIINSKMINGTLYAQTFIRNINRFIKNMWNDIIPLSHVNYVLIPITVTHYESIITNGLVLISEANIIYNTSVDSILKEREVTCLIARCVIQELFSEWLATFRQSDSWFLEGFSTIYGIYIHDQFLMESFVVQTRRIFLDYTEAFSKYDFPIQENRFITRNLTLRKLWREKAFSTFYMLNTIFEEDFLYNSMFKQAVNVYHNTNNTSDNTYNKLPILDQLWYENFEASLYEFTHMELDMTDIKQMITSWISHIGYPLVQVRRHNDTVSAMIIDCFDVDYKKPCNEKWWIPVTFKKILNTQFLATRYHVLKPDGKPIFTSLFYNNQIIVVDHLGYRINYDRETWKQIALFLKNVDPKSVDLFDVTLAQLLDDAFYFLVQNTEYNENSALDKSDLDIYFELASSIFHVNNSYTAWYPVFIALENMSKIFSFPENVLFKHIKGKLLEILNKFLNDVVYKHVLKKNISKQLYQFYHEVLKWTCILGSSKCEDHVNNILVWHFKHPAQNKLLPSWQKWIYCQELMLETVTYNKSASWQKIFNIYQTEQKEQEFFEFLPCSRQYKNLLSFLFFLENNTLPIPGSSFNARKKSDTVLKEVKFDSNGLIRDFYVPVPLPKNLTAETSDTETFVNTKKSVRVTLLFNMFALHSKNNSALSIILFGLENGIGRDVNILAILNCIINNIYSNDGLLMINNRMFLGKLMHLYHMELFAIDAITEKINTRRSFLVKMQNTILYKLKYFF